MLTSVVASFVAVAGIALGAGRNPLVAEESASCIIGGTGPLCYTVQTQECVEWNWTSIGMTPTGLTVGVTCAKWVTRTTYYYRDPGSGGGVTIKPLW
jgi:hypothetical protein